MVSMMAYGALGAALGATIRLSFDRASGWLRQLRVTPVPQRTVLAVDVVVGALLTLPSLVVVALVGRFVNHVEFGLGTWLALVGVLWAGSWRSSPRAADRPVAGGAGRRRRDGPRRRRARRARGPLGAGRDLPRDDADVAHVLPSYWYAELVATWPGGAAPSGQAVLASPGSLRCSPSWRLRSRGGGRCTPSRMSGATVPIRGSTRALERMGWAVPWLFFLAFPVADLIGSPRPVLVRAVATGALAAFAIAYLTVFGRAFARGCPGRCRTW